VFVSEFFVVILEYSDYFNVNRCYVCWCMFKFYTTM